MKYSILLAATVLTGCANGLPTLNADIPDDVSNATNKTFIGVPTLLAMEGSFVYIGNGWAVTAGHNKPILESTLKDVVYHEKCDIALFRYKSKSKPIKTGLVHQGESVYHSGYPVMLTMAYDEGKYFSDVSMQDRPGCQQSLSTGVVMGGMSGGGVWNSKNELVGINVGYTSRVTMPDGSIVNNPSIFQSLHGVKDWIFGITGIEVR